MKNLILAIYGVFAFLTLKSQNVSINNDGSSPHPSAQLDIKSSQKGILIPRTSSASRSTISSPAKGLMVYDTTTSSFWFNDGIAWLEIGNRNNLWNTRGNAGTDSTSFIGTTDDMPLLFRVRNMNSGIIDSSNYTTAFGYSTLTQNKPFTRGNAAFGGYALKSNKFGEFNTAVGAFALQSNSSGRSNTAIGAETLTMNDGSNNIAIGEAAMFSNSLGNENTAIGSSALSSNLTGSSNVAIGNGSLSYNQYGAQNTAVGYQACRWNSSNNNVAVGFESLYNTDGYANIGIGARALYNNKTGWQNIAIGDNSGVDPSTPSLYNTISIGNNGWLNAASNQVFIGNSQTLWIGGYQNWSRYSDERIKANISEDVKGLEFILKLRPVTYNIDPQAALRLTNNKQIPDYPGKDDIEKEKYTGFLAQDVEKVSREIGYEFSGLHKPKNEKTLYSLSYADFVVPLTKAVQEQQSLIVSENNQIDELKTQLLSQQQQIDQLKKLIEALQKTIK